MPRHVDAGAKLRAWQPGALIPETLACRMRHQDSRNLNAFRIPGVAIHNHQPLLRRPGISDDDGRSSRLLRMQNLVSRYFKGEPREGVRGERGLFPRM